MVLENVCRQYMWHADQSIACFRYIHTDDLEPRVFIFVPHPSSCIISEFLTTTLRRLERHFHHPLLCPSLCQRPIRGTSGSTFSSSHPPMPPATSPTSPARGVTPFLKLKNHTVMATHPLHSAQFQCGEDTVRLLPNPLKLVEMQRVIPDDPDGSPSINPRTGDVYLNLGELWARGGGDEVLVWGE